MTSTDWRQLCSEALEGRYVRLEPLRPEHAGELEPIFDRDLLRWFPFPFPSARAYVEEYLASTSIGWFIRHRESGRAAGASCYLNLSPENRRVEVGATWVAPAYQRTEVNTEAKMLLMGQAFGVLGCRRVEFKTDALNLQSQAALTKLGALREGVLRSHMLCEGDRQRDTVYFSVIAAEWPELERRLRARIER